MIDECFLFGIVVCIKEKGMIMNSKEIEKIVFEIQDKINVLHKELTEKGQSAFIDIRCKRLDVMYGSKDMMLSFQVGK